MARGTGRSVAALRSIRGPLSLAIPRGKPPGIKGTPPAGLKRVKNDHPSARKGK